MLMQVRTQGLSLAGAIERHLERRVRAALRAFASRVSAVTISFSDVNGPRGGPDLHCAVTLELIPSGSVRGEATDEDLVAAMTKALARARRSIRQDSRSGRMPGQRAHARPVRGFDG
jgi:ribosome-associated translation inhibitor RaiA